MEAPKLLLFSPSNILVSFSSSQIASQKIYLQISLYKKRFSSSHLVSKIRKRKVKWIKNLKNFDPIPIENS